VWLQPALNISCIDDLHMIDSGAWHVSKVAKKGHGAPAESVLDFDVLCSSAVEEDTGADADGGVTCEPQIGFFQVVAQVGAFCHVSDEGFDCSDAEERGLLAAFIDSVGKGCLISVEP
jgi:hypothetical protein